MSKFMKYDDIYTKPCKLFPNFYCVVINPPFE